MAVCDTPVMEKQELINYLGANAWQFNLLNANDPIRVRANVLRSALYYLQPAPEALRLAVEGDI